jgi:hypothetical protein
MGKNYSSVSSVVSVRDILFSHARSLGLTRDAEVAERKQYFFTVERATQQTLAPK